MLKLKADEVASVCRVEDLPEYEVNKNENKKIGILTKNQSECHQERVFASEDDGTCAKNTKVRSEHHLYGLYAGPCVLQ